MTDKKINFDEALKAIQAGQEITGADGVLAPLVKQLTEAPLAAELDTYLVACYPIFLMNFIFL